jgi:hypothetical protein
MHTKILKRCGIVLITVGVLDIGYMIWCIANHISYSSSFNIFALIGGIFLYRGGIKTARWVIQLSTFMLVACGVFLLVMPFMYPLGYWIAVFKHGSGFIMSTFITITFFALLVWLRLQMTRPEVSQAILTAGLQPPRIKFAIAAGLALPVLLLALLSFMLHGDTAHEAIRRAEKQLGGEYHYVVTNLQIESNETQKSVNAIVVAYNNADLKNVQINWKE